MVHAKGGTDHLPKKGGDGPFPIKGGKSGQSITQSGNKSEQHKLLDFTKF
ncbi:hypothetical protein Misp06_03042 [Microbulbifer sp. NBRC 101763]